MSEEIEKIIMQEIKSYVKSLDTPDNKIYQENSLLIMSCFSKAMEIVENCFKSLPIRDEAVVTDEMIEGKAYEYGENIHAGDRFFADRDFVQGAKWIRALYTEGAESKGEGKQCNCDKCRIMRGFENE